MFNQASARLNATYRPFTLANLQSYFKVFLSYCAFYQFDHSAFTVSQLLGFIETLACSNMKYSNIVNHISGIKTIFIQNHYNSDIFSTFEVKSMLRACAKTLPYTPTVKGIFTVETITEIIIKTQGLDNPRLYKALFLLAFFSFLRISNLLPASAASFNALRQLCRGDIIFHSKGAIVLVKRTKTIQNPTDCIKIPLPLIEGSILCPVAALQQFIKYNPACPNDPLFIIKHHQASNIIITQNRARSVLESILKQLGLPKSYNGFHTFRRSGATLAYQLGVPIPSIQNHGTWISDTVWRYIKHRQPGNAITSAFTKLLLP